MEEKKGTGTILIILSVLLVICATAVFLWGAPKYRIYKQDLRGQAELREQTWIKKIAIEEAAAEVARAEGIAEANKIIGDSLKDNEGYLKYRMIEGMTDSETKTIYIPTEAGLPILEAK